MQMNRKQKFLFMSPPVCHTWLCLGFLFVFALCRCFADSILAISVESTDGKMKLGFQGKQQEFAEIQRHLKHVASVGGTNLTVTFFVQQETINLTELIDMTFAIQSIGFNYIFIETQASTNKEEYSFLKIRVIPVSDEDKRKSRKKEIEVLPLIRTKNLGGVLSGHGTDKGVKEVKGNSR